MKKMTPEEFLEQVKQAYHDAKRPTKPGEGVFRHRVRSTSGVQEDLVAYFIRSQTDNLQVHIDQPITIRPPNGVVKRKKTWYPDIVVVRRPAPSEKDGSDGTIIALVDVKTDLGWNRADESFKSICENLQSIRLGLLQGRHRPLPKPPPRRRRGQKGDPKPTQTANFNITKLRCDERMSCHVVVVTAANSGDILKAKSQRQKIAKSLKVNLHVLMQLHPNMSKQQIAKTTDAVQANLATADDLIRASLRPKDFESLKAIILGAAK